MGRTEKQTHSAMLIETGTSVCILREKWLPEDALGTKIITACIIYWGKGRRLGYQTDFD